jgi:hypothetical protein
MPFLLKKVVNLRQQNLLSKYVCYHRPLFFTLLNAKTDYSLVCNIISAFDFIPIF